MQTRSALKIFLEREQQRQDENSPSCFLLETSVAKVTPHRSAKKEALKLLTRTQGQKVLELLPT